MHKYKKLISYCEHTFWMVGGMMQWQVEEKMEKVHGEPKQLMESNINSTKM